MSELISTDNNVIPQIKRNRGSFVKGVSGNPNGRPKGSKNQVTLAKFALEADLRKQLGYDMSEILAKCIELAKAGDTSMIKLLIDKCISSSRSSDDSDAVDKSRIQIVINKLPGTEPVSIQGETINGN